MHPKKQTTLIKSDPISKQACFWSCGNKPTQELFGLSGDEILIHLRCLYLLYDKIVCAASFYFESDITRSIARNFSLLVKRGDILFFVNEEIEDFVEHGRMKVDKSPKELSAYNDIASVIEIGKELNSYGQIMKRPSISISDRIAELWIKDVLSYDEGTIGDCLNRFYKSNNELQRHQCLAISAADNREKDFVWDYIKLRLEGSKFPNHIIFHMRKRLSQMYCLSTSEFLGLNLDLAHHAFSGNKIDKRSRYDTYLFLECMRLLGIEKSLNTLNADSLMVLKGSPEFKWFREFYFLLIDAAANHGYNIEFYLPLYREAAIKFPNTYVSYEDFISIFGRLCKSIISDVNSMERPLELLIHTYRLFNRHPIEDFVEKIRQLSPIDAIESQFERKELVLSHDISNNKAKHNLFISYSHKDKKWLERLQVHLKPVEQRGVISLWDDTMIKVGAKWRDEIKNAINNANATILLISADFLASDFIINNELPPLLKSAQQKGVKILPLIVSHCLFNENQELSQFQAFNSPSEPMIKMSKAKQEATLTKLANIILNVI